MSDLTAGLIAAAIVGASVLIGYAMAKDWL